MAYDPVSDEDQAPDYVIPLAFKDDCDVTFREETARDVFLKLLEEGISPYEDGVDGSTSRALADKAVELTDALISRLERKD